MSIYKLGVVPIPTNMPMIRADQPDLVYKTEIAKFEAVVEDIVERHELGQPVLVGTTSVEKSEYLSRLLVKRGVRHDVLNAKQHEREASIVAQAGRKHAVTVATNMAGRGTDIMLGGNAEFIAVSEMKRHGLDPVETPEEYEAAWPDILRQCQEGVKAEHEEVVEAGGLYVLGTERHESRRIDNQLRGRSGRQGDPGESRFYLSLTDDLMRLFNSGVVESFLSAAKIPDDVPIESKMVSRAIASAQNQVEARNFEIRKNVLKYDDVMSRQREVIYDERRKVLEGADLREQVRHFLDDVVHGYVVAATADNYAEDWDLEQLWQALKALYPVSITIDEVLEEAGGAGGLTQDLLLTEFAADVQAAYDRRESLVGGPEIMRELERRVVLSVLDRKWREHLYEMDYLQEGIALRAYAQRDPLVEYQREGYQLFQAMTEAIKEESVGFLFNVEVQVETPQDQVPQDRTPQDGAPAPVLVAKGLVAPQRPARLQYSAPSVDGGSSSLATAVAEAAGPGGDGAAAVAPPPSTGNRAERRAAAKRNRRR